MNYQKFPERSPLMKMCVPKYSETSRFHSTVFSRMEKSNISVAHCPQNRMRLTWDIWKYRITPIIREGYHLTNVDVQVYERNSWCKVLNFTWKHYWINLVFLCFKMTSVWVLTGQQMRICLWRNWLNFLLSIQAKCLFKSRLVLQ